MYDLRRKLKLFYSNLKTKEKKLFLFILIITVYNKFSKVD